MAAKVPVYDLSYAQFDSPALALVRGEAFGEDIGQQSWSTAEEYRQFSTTGPDSLGVGYATDRDDL